MSTQDVAVTSRSASRRHTPAILALTLTLFTLTACAPEVADITADPPAPVEQAPAPEADPLAGLASGDPISAEDAEALNAAYGMALDDRGYQMADGAYVLLRGGEPLPAPVIEQVTANVAGPASGIGTSTDRATRDVALAGMFDTMEAEETNTGRTIVAVSHALTWRDALHQYVPSWLVSEPGPTGEYGSRDEAVAAAQGWVDKSPGTRALIVMDLIG